MAGLLDGFGEFARTPEGQGLLSAVFGGLAGARKGAPMNSLGTAGLAGLQGYSGALDRNAQMEQIAQQNELRKAQMANYQSEADQRTAQAKAGAVRQQALANPFTTSRATGGDVSAPELGGVEMFSQGVKPAAPYTPGTQSIDVQKLLAAGVKPEEIAAIDGLRNLGKQKVARTMKGIGPDGREYEYQVDEFGGKVGEGSAQWKAPLMTDLGGNVSALDPYTLKPQAVMPKTMTFGDKAAQGNLGIAQQRLGLDRQKFAFDKAGGSAGAEAAKPQLVDGQWVYKPDAQNPQGRVVPVLGMADKTMTDSQSKAHLFGSRMQEAENVIKSVSDKADRPGLIKRTAQSTVGIIPSWLGGEQLADVAGAATNWTQSDAQQQVEQAQDNFLNAILRRESGAVIGADEKRNASKQYFPEVGDSDARIAQKAANRKTAIEGVLAEVPAKRNAPMLNVPNAPSGSFSDPSKESRYQEWKRKNGG